ncbi:hypothetical protein ACRTC8_03590 [Vibrio cholerae]|uniref:hypothetical protein n=1 Tax=Vibrio cholerae TaxID=666 RepID=UPI003D7DB4A2
MKLSAVTFALMLASASASASASITTFSTKNNTYTPPAPTTGSVPEELRKRFDTCPTIYDPLPIRIKSGTRGAYVRVNFLAGRFGDTINEPLPYGKVVQDTSKFEDPYTYNAMLFDPNYNYMSTTSEFSPYLVGGGKGATIKYSDSIYWQKLRFGDQNNKLPVYVTPTYEVKSATFDKNILLPTRDVDVFEVLIFNQVWDINGSPRTVQKIVDVLSNTKHRHLESRITFYRNKDDQYTWNYIFDNPGGVSLSIFGYNSNYNSDRGSIDIRKVRNIEFNFDTLNSNAGGGTKLSTIINQYGKRALKFVDSADILHVGYVTDPSIPDALVSAEQRVYTENNCFYR